MQIHAAESSNKRMQILDAGAVTRYYDESVFFWSLYCFAHYISEKVRT